jgi:hypothetical protein
MNKIPHRVREEAALICALTASSPKRYALYAHSAKWIGASKAALSLAYEAGHQAFMTSDLDGGCQELDAEAEALLRTGWSPS